MLKPGFLEHPKSPGPNHDTLEVETALLDQTQCPFVTIPYIAFGAQTGREEAGASPAGGV